MMRFFRRFLVLVAVVVPALLLCADLFARAGGGGGYHGGGGGGGGGSHGGGGGGGGGDLIELIFWLVFYHPFVGLPTIIAVVLVFIYVQRIGTDAYRSSIIRRGSALLDEEERAAMLAPL